MQVPVTVYLDVTPGTEATLEEVFNTAQELIKVYAAGLTSSKFTVNSAKVFPHG